MNKIKKRTVSIVFIIVFFIVIGIIALNAIVPSPVSKEKMERELNKSYNDIMIVINYLTQYDENIIIYPNDEYGKIQIRDNNSLIQVHINDEQISNAINKLLKTYKIIEKNDTTVFFQRSNRLMDFSSGIAYVYNGEEPNIQLLSYIEPLSKEKWYYYETDINKFK